MDEFTPMIAVPDPAIFTAVASPALKERAMAGRRTKAREQGGRFIEVNRADFSKYLSSRRTKRKISLVNARAFGIETAKGAVGGVGRNPFWYYRAAAGNIFRVRAMPCGGDRLLFPYYARSIWASKPEYYPQIWVWLPNIVFRTLGVVMFRRIQKK
jgi:hypothetical protein